MEWRPTSGEGERFVKVSERLGVASDDINRICARRRKQRLG